MSQPQHTPGPWVTRANTCADVGEHERVAKFWPMHGGFQIIADCSYAATHGSDHAANARLIASAPELLEVAQAMLPANLCVTNPNIRDDQVVPLEVTMGELRKIRAIIAKATGAA